MGVVQSNLSEQDRKKLDGIVQKMIDNKEPEENIRLVVDDFKSLYGKKKTADGLPIFGEEPKSTEDGLPIFKKKAATTSQGYTNSLPPAIKSIVMAEPAVSEGSGDKLSVSQFAKKVKEKYPEYTDVDDRTLANRVLAKYPEYQTQVELDDEHKQKVLDYLNKTKQPAKEVSGKGAIINQKPLTVAKTTKKKDTYLVPVNEEIDKKAREKISEVMYAETDEWKDPLKSLSDKANASPDIIERTSLNHALNISTSALMPDGYEALKVLNSSVWGKADDSNLTKKALLSKANDYLGKTVELRNNLPQSVEGADDDWLDYNTLPSMRSAALNWYARQNSNFAKQLEESEIDPNASNLDDIMPSGKMGQILNEYLRSPEVRTFFSKEDPDLEPIHSYAQRSLLVKHPDYGANVVANEVSREIQKRGYNDIDPIFNFASKTTKDYANTIAEIIYMNDPVKMGIYNKYILGNEENYLDTPSFFEGFASAGKEMMQGVKSTFTTPFTPISETIKDKWKEEAAYVSADPKGLSKFLRDTGHATGIVASIGAGSNLFGAAGVVNPKTAAALATSTSFLGDQLEQGIMKYPDSPVKAWTSAVINTSLYAALSYDLFPAAKAMAGVQKVKPELNKVVENLASGKISREAARAEANSLVVEAVRFAGDALATNTKIAAEMTAITSMNRVLDKVMGMDEKTFDQYHPEDEEADTFKSMFLSNGLVSALTAVGKARTRNSIAEETLWEAANNPKYYERVIDELEVKQPGINTKELQSNLQFLSTVLVDIESQQMKPELQKKYLVAAIRQKVAEEKMSSTVDSEIKKNLKEEVATIKEEKQQMLSGEYVEEAITDQSELHQEAATEIKAETPARETIQPPPIAKEAYPDLINEMAKEQEAAKTLPGRIPVAPISGEKPKNLSEILFDVSKGLKQKLFYTKPDAARAIGTYSPGSTAVKLRNAGDLDTAAHELGHSIDDRVSFIKKASIEVKDELMSFAPYGSTPPKGHPNPKSYELAEGFAEWLRALIVNPEEAQKVAPHTYQHFTTIIPEKAKQIIQEFSNNVRALAGATGRDVILSNIEVEPKKEGTIQKLLSSMKKDDGFTITWADKLSANFLDPLKPFVKAWDYAKGMRGVDEVLPQDDPTVLVRLIMGHDGKFGEVLKSGMINSRNEIVTDAEGNPKNLKWLLEPLRNDTQEAVKEDMADVIAFMVAERTVELADKFGRDTVITGVGAGIYSDIAVAEKALQQFEQMPAERQKRITEAADRYRSLANDNLKYLVDKGRLSEAQYERILADNLQYVALNRILESEPNQEIEVYRQTKRSIGSSSTPVYEIKGSTRKIQNPYTSLLDSMYKSIREADRNEVLRSFRDMLINKRGMGEGMPEALAEIGIKVKSDEKNVIPIFIDGKPEYWKFQPDVYEALKGYASDGWRFHPAATLHARVLRWSVTNWPVFAARNFIRDFQDRLVKSNENVGLSGFTNIVGKKTDWAELARTGGLNAGYYVRDRQHYYGLLKEGIKEMSSSGNTIVVDALNFKEHWKKYENFLHSGETINRVAEYRSAFDNAKRKGMDDYNASLYAADKARGLIDFATMGHYMKLVNQIVPFSNAAVQGLRSSFIKAKENPKAFGVRMALYTVIPQIAAWLIAHRNDEDAKEYENLPWYQRDMAWNFKIGDNKWLSLPKPFELSLPAAGVDRLLSYHAGNKEAFDGYNGTLLKSFVPVDESALGGSFLPLVEMIANYDFFRNKPIVPAHESVLNLALRNNESSSRLGLLLQKHLGVDARKIDHFIKGQFSYFGDAAMKLSNAGADDKKAEFSITDTGIIKNSPAYNSPAVQEFMNYAKEWKLTTTRDYKLFLSLANQYFSATTDADKEKYGQQMVETAKMLLKGWKDAGVSDFIKGREEEKRRVGKGTE